MDGKDLTKHFEGFKNQVYKDTLGNLTVGYGTHLYEGKKIPQEAVVAMFEFDYTISEKEYNNLYLSDLDAVRKAVIIDLIYNMGVYRVTKFRKMLDAISSRNYERAANELLNSEYAEQTKTRAQVNADMLRTGKWPDFIKK